MEGKRVTAEQILSEIGIDVERIMVFRDVLPSRKPCCTERDGWHNGFGCFSAGDFGVERGYYS